MTGALFTQRRAYFTENCRDMKKIVLAFAFVLVYGGAAAAAADPALVKAQSLLEKGDNKAAIAAMNEYIAKNPGNARAYVIRGDAEDNLGNNSAALTDYNTAIGINPDYEYAYASRCDTQNELGNYRDAIKDCDKALSLDAKDDYAYRARSYSSYMIDDYDAALADAEKAIAIDPANPWNMLARCRANVGLEKPAVALPACNAFINAKPDSASGYFLRGRAYMLQQNNASARPDFVKTFALDDQFFNAQYWISVIDLNDKKYAAALDDANVYLKHFPDDADTLLLRARAEFGLGDKTAAKNDALRALHQYQIDNDTDGAKNAQSLVDQIGQ